MYINIKNYIVNQLTQNLNQLTCSSYIYLCIQENLEVKDHYIVNETASGKYKLYVCGNVLFN